MADYKTMYIKLLKSTEKAVNELINAQRCCEEIYIRSTEEEENLKVIKMDNSENKK